MRIAILDPFAGISGDMILGALVDLGVDRAWLESLPRRLGLSDVKVEIGRVIRCSVAATKVSFVIQGGHKDMHGHHDHGHAVSGLVKRIEQADLSDTVKLKAAHAFELLGEAEGSVHGIDPAEVHLHEVGAVDALLDIVGAVEGFELLGTGAIYGLPVAVGRGWVDAAHGALPVPAPATMILLEGIDVRVGGPVVGEATTPTGATLVRVLSDGPPPSAWRVSGTGWGAGDRDPPEYPNVLRILLAERAPEAGITEIIATDVDDMSPEYLEPLRQAALEAGAVDCQVWPTQGKKGRVSLRIEAVVPLEAGEQVAEALFANSSTTGIRRWTATRNTLVRRELEVEPSKGLRERVKVSEGPNGPRTKAEFDDVVMVAKETGMSPIEVARKAETLAEGVLRSRKAI
jgi:uncharacterized protein (TIGR00299 family) protein